MILVFLAMLQAQPALDPLSKRMHLLCRGRPQCVAEQREGVKTFLNTLTRFKAPPHETQKCLDRSTKKGLTDWKKAASCLQAWAKRAQRRR